MAALRSGEYLQTHSQLGRVEVGEVRRYCCEGVAVERYGEQLGYKVQWNGDSLSLDDQYDYVVNDFWEALGLNTDASKNVGTRFALILPDNLAIRHDDRISEIPYMALNDDGLTFAQIADLIEWQFLPCRAS